MFKIFHFTFNIIINVLIIKFEWINIFKDPIDFFIILILRQVMSILKLKKNYNFPGRNSRNFFSYNLYLIYLGLILIISYKLTIKALIV